TLFRSLSRRMRLSAEDRLKQGHTRVVIATASLELGIDIGFVDLVCQIGSPRAIATCLQRIGRAGHWVGATPKGRLFCTTRDELIECAALIRAIQQGHLDQILIPSAPLDILAQQLVAEIAAQEWDIDKLFRLCTQSYPYRNLTRARFDEIITMLAHGFIPNQGRQQAYVFHDQVQRLVRPRRGARLAAITSGGAIPDTATYAVVTEPQGTIIGSVDEDFAVESMAGDIILLGNTSWRIRGVGTGVMRVEDAQGAPPTIPFWRGEAPARTSELSEEVAVLRQEIMTHSGYVENGTATFPEKENNSPDKAIIWLKTHCGLDRRAAEQATSYQLMGHQTLGDCPTQQTIIAERFFDEAGGMQLVIHAPFGGRLTRAWGLALRKRFCVSFDFELQAAATDEGLVLSLGEKHSFPLEVVFSMLHSNTVRDVLTQAVLQSPMFIARWRWNASRALALLRFRNGKRVPLHLQRLRAEDLLTAIFPMATACQDNRPPGNIEIPDHPLVQETIRDCLEEAMDINGLVILLKRIEQGQIRCVAVQTPTPSVFSHEILNANPYAFLDDAPLEERRARAVNMRQMLPPEEAGSIGALDTQAILTICDEVWPLVRNPDELHDALHMLIMIPEREGAEWAPFLPELLATKRAFVLTLPDHSQDGLGCMTVWVAYEHLPLLQATFPEICLQKGREDTTEKFDQREVSDRQEFYLALIRSWMEIVGPTTAKELVEKLGLSQSGAHTALIQLEAEGQVLQGTFRPNRTKTEVEWCHRRLLARIHRRTVTRLRREIEAVPASVFMRFLFRWQHVAPTSRLHGENGTLEIVRQLAGFEAAATAWEPFLLKARIANYSQDKLDYLCLRGTATWGRLTPPTISVNHSNPRRKSRVIPTSLAPISVFPREDADWLLTLSRVDARIPQAMLPEKVSAVAQALYHYLCKHGASFFADLTKGTNHLQAEVEQALWELTSVGLVTADGFDNLRALLDPKRRRGIGRHDVRRPRHTIGRWCLLAQNDDPTSSLQELKQDPIESWARQLLTRYGIVFRDVLKRESLPFAWRDLLTIYRRLELRGEIRGGRFVSGFTGDQFGLPEAVEALRAIRKDPQAGAERIQLAGSDPLNLVGIILPGDRIPAVPSQQIIFENGVPISDPRLSAALA
ncbi:MAG: helicase-related protein, partial [Nitrospirota bacterium]|nr:helicase-related protein [Nitrospirota bacterium]